MEINSLLDNKWLKIDVNAKHGDIIKIKDEGIIEQTKEGEDRLVLQVEVYRDGSYVIEKTFGVNKTNLKTLKDLFGMDTKSWVGKEASINRMMVRNPRDGKLVASIVLTEVLPAA